MMHFNNIKTGTVTLLLGMAVLSAQGQITSKEVTNQKVVWASLTETILWNSRWSTVLNAQDRLFVDTRGSFQLLLNTVSYYKANDNIKLGGGFLFFDSRRRLTAESPLVDVIEWRPYQSIKVDIGKNHWKLMNRLNIEERFQENVVSGTLSDQYKFSFRFRLKWEFSYQLWKGRKDNILTIVVSTEPMINAGANIVNNTFDQNRLITQLSYQVNPAWSVSSGYMNWKFQRPSGASFDIRHVWLMGISHRV